jgi:hypothetical protein
LLRDFRDDHLVTNAPGRAFVAWYYRNSPPLASWIARNENRRAVVRVLLTPLFLAVTEPQTVGFAAVFALAASSLFVVRRRQVLRRPPC